jgi:hypothetical protein
MTTTDERIAGTALAQVAADSQAYLTAIDPGKTWTLAALTKMLAGEAPQPTVPPAGPPETLTVTPELRAALRLMTQLFGGVQPTEPRKLEEAEVRRITEEYRAIAAVAGLIAKRANAIDEAVRHHMDAEARAAGITGPIIADGKARGHILAAKPGQPFEVNVEGFSDAWQQRMTTGSAELSMTDLWQLLDEKLITRDEFSALTSTVRELDESKIKKAVKRNPARYLAILASITRRKPDGASLYPPKG